MKSILKKYLDQEIGINIERPLRIDSARLVAADDNYFSVIDENKGYAGFTERLYSESGGRFVLTVAPGEDSHKVTAEAVELLYADATRAFVRGALPDGALLLQTGPHRVAPGQTVRLKD